jgi:hypothetical protein
MGALDTAVRPGRTLYVGISSYSPEMTIEAARIIADLGAPFAANCWTLLAPISADVTAPYPSDHVQVSGSPKSRVTIGGVAADRRYAAGASSTKPGTGLT